MRRSTFHGQDGPSRDAVPWSCCFRLRLYKQGCAALQRSALGSFGWSTALVNDRSGRRELGVKRVTQPGFEHVPGALDQAGQSRLLAFIRAIVADAPLYTPTMPNSGKPFSVAMTNCGTLGWVSDKAGYRYQSHHPKTGRAWPPMPPLLLDLWRSHARCALEPEACLVNYYAAGAKMGSHRDADEDEARAPVLSISLGDDAVFHIGGRRRTDAKFRYTLKSGDIVILGGESRLAYHGVDRIVPGTSPVLAEGGRFNLTLRRVRRAQQ